MLGKLLKHEFRATARMMLPMLAVLFGLNLLADASMLLAEHTREGFLAFLLALIVGLFFVGVIVAVVMTLVVLTLRFYRNFFGDEGYVTFTLPATVHEQLWAKLLAALVWFFATMLEIALCFGLMGLTLSLMQGFDFSGIVWDNLREALRQFGTLGLDSLFAMLIGTLVMLLQLYAAMSLGQMFSKKVLMSVVFFFALNLAASILGSAVTLPALFHPVVSPQSYPDAVRLFAHFIRSHTFTQLVFGVALYFCSVLCLKKRLNLA